MPENKNENQRPAWAQNMDEGQWEKVKNSESKNEKNTEANTSPKASTNNIQEDNISASTNISVAESKMPSLEDLEAAIIKKSENKKAEPSEQKQTFSSNEHSGPEKTSEESSSPLSSKPNVDKNQDKSQELGSDKKIGNVADRSSYSKFTYKPNTYADEAERPVRGYGILTFLPLLTLSILLTIHVISFIYSYSNKVLVQSNIQIEVAKNLQLDGDLFIPTLQHITESAVSPAQLWYLSMFYKWLPFSDATNLHLAAAISALLLLCAVYLYSKATAPGNKAVAFSAGLVLLSSTLFLGGAWFFSPIILATALLFLSYYFIFKGLKHPTPALRYFIPGMILAALAVLAGGIIIALVFIITLFVYLLISNQLKRLACKDLPVGLAVFAAILGLWLIGALFFRGIDGVSAYLLPLTLTQGACQVTWSLQHKILFTVIFLLPWLVAPLLVFDQTIKKLSSLRSSLQTEEGQGTLFLICSLFAAAAVLTLDRLDHPFLLIISLPPIAVLAGRAVLYMKRSRARIFIIITALLFVALTGFIIIMTTPWGKDIFPWDLSIWTVAPLAGASIFCAVFLIRAAQVSAGKTLLLGFAICWLLMAQVFLFTGMPAAMASLKAVTPLATQPSTPQSQLKSEHNSTAELTNSTPTTTFAMPVFNATLPSTLPSMNGTLPSTIPSFNGTLPSTIPSFNATVPAFDNATMPNATMPSETTNQNDKNIHTQNATTEMPSELAPSVNGTSFNQNNATSPTATSGTVAPVLAEETIITTFAPKKRNKVDLVYGTIPSPPELVISVRYQTLKTIE